MTHDFKRNGTTTLFAALNVLEGKVIGRRVPRHRHQEFIRFITTVERSTTKAPAALSVPAHSGQSAAAMTCRPAAQPLVIIKEAGASATRPSLNQ